MDTQELRDTEPSLRSSKARIAPKLKPLSNGFPPSGRPPVDPEECEPSSRLLAVQLPNWVAVLVIETFAVQSESLTSSELVIDVNKWAPARRDPLLRVGVASCVGTAQKHIWFASSSADFRIVNIGTGAIAGIIAAGVRKSYVCSIFFDLYLRHGSLFAFKSVRIGYGRGSADDMSVCRC